MKKSNFSFWLDVALLALLAVTVLTLFGRDRTSVNQPRVVLHCMAGALMLVGSIIHLILHWDWIRTVVFHAPAKIKRGIQSRRRTDIWLFIAAVPCGVAGIMVWLLQAGIVTLAGLPLQTWNAVHNLAGMVMLFGLSLHLVQHSAWVAHALRRGHTAIIGRQGPRQAPVPSWPASDGGHGR